jgi:hypothetical protein
VSERTLAEGSRHVRRRDILPVAGQNVEHVLVQPFQLVAHRVAKILQFLRYKRVRLMALLENPSGRPDGGCLATCSHVGCVLWGGVGEEVRRARRVEGSRGPGEGIGRQRLPEHVDSKCVWSDGSCAKGKKSYLEGAGWVVVVSGLPMFWSVNNIDLAEKGQSLVTAVVYPIVPVQPRHSVSPRPLPVLGRHLHHASARQQRPSLS